MSKLKKIYISGFGSRGNGYETHLEYSPRLKEFFIRVPGEQAEVELKNEDGVCLWAKRGVKGYDGVPVFSSDTENAVIHKAEEYYKIFSAATKTERTIIAYKFEYHSRDIVNTDHTWPGSENKCALEMYDCVVLLEQIYGGERRLLQTSEVGYGIEVTMAYKNYRCMDWTEAREAFFRDTRESMHRMISAVDAFVDDAEALPLTLDAGSTFLLMENSTKGS